MVRPVFKTGSGRITPSVAGSIPALSVAFRAASPKCSFDDFTPRTPRSTSMTNNSRMRSIPSVGEILQQPPVEALVDTYGRELVGWSVRRCVAKTRARLYKGAAAVSVDELVSCTSSMAASIAGASLRSVINATGVMLHTNLGRAPLGARVMREIAETVEGYSNLEFDLAGGKRGSRSSHIVPLLSYLTGAEDAVVVNNNAAGIILVLNTFARRKEVIISRGELIEIGGAFRIPDIMKAGGAKMVEVGTTNRTRLSDYEQAITPKTALLFKAHASNYTIQGFTEDVSAGELAGLAHAHGLPMVYDIGSGLLRNPGIAATAAEPDVRGALTEGCDLVAFSCDKLLGGPQAGVVAGKSEYVSRLARAPLMRALRVGKLTVAALACACRHYLNEQTLRDGNPAMGMFALTPDHLQARAERLGKLLAEKAVEAEIVENDAQCGGGAAPGKAIESRAVGIVPPDGSSAARRRFGESLFHGLLSRQRPVVGILREGRVLLDVLTVEEKDLDEIASAVADVLAGDLN